MEEGSAIKDKVNGFIPGLNRERHKLLNNKQKSACDGTEPQLVPFQFVAIQSSAVR
jgi:hypothetical protein